MNQNIAQAYELLNPNQKAWFDKRVAGLDEPAQRDWLLYVKVEERLNQDGVAVKFNHDMSGFYFTYAVKERIRGTPSTRSSRGRTTRARGG